MSNTEMNTKQGHWILAKMGKKVLRPGGKELTQKLINGLGINTEDTVVEFAPGLGYTAALTLKKSPRSYTGVELNEEAAAILRKKIVGPNKNIIIGNASRSTLQNEYADKVYGEAMLTMNADHRKSEIIKEAHRILKKDGLYGIHELCLMPNEIAKDTKQEIQKELANAIKVNARPLTNNEWSSLLEAEGFTVLEVGNNPMHLLEKKRVLDDEGFFRTLKIVFNIMTHPKARQRIMAMRKVFRKYEEHLGAVMIIAKKNT
ncbi:MAG: SAM-dependent methyltransferase [Maribacter sp.]|nr:MAG: SAM-dependent methyltransferase [Maribacter sp.]